METLAIQHGMVHHIDLSKLDLNCKNPGHRAQQMAVVQLHSQFKRAATITHKVRARLYVCGCSKDCHMDGIHSLMLDLAYQGTSTFLQSILGRLSKEYTQIYS